METIHVNIIIFYFKPQLHILSVTQFAIKNSSLRNATPPAIESKKSDKIFTSLSQIQIYTQQRAFCFP